MHYVDRWLISQAIATVVLLLLVIIVGVPHHLWLDVLHMWFVTMSINNLRLTFSRDRHIEFDEVWKFQIQFDQIWRSSYDYNLSRSHRQLLRQG